MVDIGSIAGAAQGIKAAFDIAKALKNIHDAATIQVEVAKLLETLVEAQMRAAEAVQKQSALVERVRALEAELQRAETWEADKQRYELKGRPGTAGEIMTYRLKESMAGGEPTHEACPNCYGQRRISILQPLPGPQRSVLLTCPACKTALSTYEQ